MAWVRACAVDGLAEGEAMQLDVQPPIALFNVEGDFFAIDDTCTHNRASLSEGHIAGGQVACAWHLAKFCIKTGKVLSPPARRPVQTYPVKVEDSDIFVEVPERDGRQKRKGRQVLCRLNRLSRS